MCQRFTASFCSRTPIRERLAWLLCLRLWIGTHLKTADSLPRQQCSTKSSMASSTSPSLTVWHQIQGQAEDLTIFVTTKLSPTSTSTNILSILGSSHFGTYYQQQQSRHHHTRPSAWQLYQQLDVCHLLLPFMGGTNVIHPRTFFTCTFGSVKLITVFVNTCTWTAPHH